MGVKSADQVTIVDVTDAYSVILTSEAYTFVGNTSGAQAGSSCTTQAVAFCGTNQCNVVTIDVESIVCPSGISVSVSNSGTATPTVTFTTTGTLSDDCEATIPVNVDGITVNKKFSFAVAKQGSAGKDGKNGSDGANGADGADAISISIQSSNGTIFKNSSGTTVLTARVFVGAIEQGISDDGSCGDLGVIKWYKNNEITAISTSKSITVTASDVSNAASYTCQLEG